MMLSEVLDPRTRSLINLASISNYVMSNDLISSALAQVGRFLGSVRFLGRLQIDSSLSVCGTQWFRKQTKSLPVAVGDDRRPFGPFGRGWSLHRHRVFAASLRLTLATAAVSLTHAVPASRRC